VTGKRGRPREVEDPVRVTVRLSAETYDRLDRVARDRDTTIPALIRDRMARTLATELGQAWEDFRRR
jgi:predicted transcriptional regulator